MNYRKTPPKPTAAQVARADDLDRQADDCRRRSQASFDRCDTDGFLSQWALDLEADRLRQAAILLRNGGYARFPVLVDKAGNVVTHRLRTFRNPFGGIVTKWHLPKSAAIAYGRTWVPFGARSRIQKQLGLRQADRWTPAVAAIRVPEGQKATGLAGAANAGVRVIVSEETAP